MSALRQTLPVAALSQDPPHAKLRRVISLHSQEIMHESLQLNALTLVPPHLSSVPLMSNSGEWLRRTNSKDLLTDIRGHSDSIANCFYAHSPLKNEPDTIHSNVLLPV
jgi:hypothetical protein